jgi:hypothetical protein
MNDDFAGVISSNTPAGTQEGEVSMMRTDSKNIAARKSRMKSGPSVGYPWFQLSIATGVALAMVLLASSISTYTAVSRRLILDHLRADLHSQAALMEEQAQRGSVQSRSQLSAILQGALEKSNGRIAWILVQNHEGEPLSAIGSPATPVFSTQDIRSHIESRRPIFKTVDAATGPMLVEVMPFMLPHGPLRASLEAAGGALGRPVTTVEIAESWAGGDVALWSVRRHLIINASAALVLLLALATLGLRFRAYLAGQKLEQEIEVARTVQRDLLPSSQCELDDFEVSGDYAPLAQVGGDFYDTFAVRGDRAAFVLGDVSGKGLPAALLMGVLHGAVRSSGWTLSPLDHQTATSEMNRLLCERAATSRFATMFWSYFDYRSQHLKYINAGHCPPLLVKTAQRKTVLHLCSGGPVLGLLADAEFQQGSARLDAGDVLILYSDGIVEATNAADEEFGEDRVAAIVRAHSVDTAENIRDRILAAVDAFTGAMAPQDDRTLVVIVYLGAERGDGSDLEAAPELALCAA